jgi:hypothetical protein
LIDLGRTAYLDALHRTKGQLGAFLADCLGLDTGSHIPARSIGPLRTAQPQVEFIPVPMPPQEKPKGKGNGDRGVLESPLSRLKGGAGLELDLADPRQRERLPADLRHALPNKGLVNYPEAQAVVRCLLTLKSEQTGTQGAALPVAVVALYSAQAALIERMLRQTAELVNGGLVAEVGTASAFRQREFGHVLISLTRSHTHRAVSYGETPRLLAMALTRARERLILFGDPGTLIRRAQWDGPLEQFDEAAAGEERQLVAQLVRYLQGQGAHPHCFRVRQGNGP